MRTFFILTFFVVQSLSVWAVQLDRQLTAYTKEDCQQLIDEAFLDSNNKNYAAALEKLLKAEMIAEENQWTELLLDINLNLGNNFKHLSDYGEALNYYRKTLNLIQKDQSLYKKANTPLMNIAILYGVEKNFEESFRYYDQAYDLVKNDQGSPEKN